MRNSGPRLLGSDPPEGARKDITRVSFSFGSSGRQVSALRGTGSPPAGAPGFEVPVLKPGGSQRLGLHNKPRVPPRARGLPSLSRTNSWG
eukprot:13617630-Heterocapsa_arctica.AAC.1